MNENKLTSNAIDRVAISMLEAQQVKAYVIHYLYLRGYADSKENENVLTRHLKQYPQRGIVRQEVLTHWLDALLA